MIVEAGVPATLNYAERRERPFFRVLESLCFFKINRHKELDFLKLRAEKSIAAQGYPGFGLHTELTSKLATRAHEQVAEYAQRLYPWFNFESGDKAVEAALRKEAPALIAEWYRYFEPENLDAYLEKLRERAKADAERD